MPDSILPEIQPLALKSNPGAIAFQTCPLSYPEPIERPTGISQAI
jgi:hypothetical protein